MKNASKIRLQILGIMAASLSIWVAAAYPVPEFTPQQLADPAFVQQAIAKAEAARSDLEARRSRASSLQLASLDNDLKKAGMVLEFLQYVKAHGYRADDPGLIALAYVKNQRKISSQELPQVAKNPAAGGEPAGRQAPAPAETPVISHGEPVDIERHLVKGKTVVFDFYSDYCGPCRQVGPRLEKLDARRDDLVVIRVDINRPGVQGIDWNSTVARQYGLRSIPHFVVYSPDGKKVAEGQEASAQVYKMLGDAGL
jgi:thiol-disulfide isomerase/thioredoxin